MFPSPQRLSEIKAVGEREEGFPSGIEEGAKTFFLPKERIFFFFGPRREKERGQRL